MKEDIKIIPVNKDKIAKARYEAKERVLANLPEGLHSSQMSATTLNYSNYTASIDDPVDKQPIGYNYPVSAYVSTPKKVFPTSNVSVPKKNKEKKSFFKNKPKTEFNIIEKKRKISW